MKLTAIYHIDRDAKANPRRVPPGTVFDATDEEVAVLLPMFAAREATDLEIALSGAPEIADPAPIDPDQQIEPADEAVANRAALEARAKDLGVKFNANLSDEKLAERVAEAQIKVDADKDTLV